MKKNNLKKSIIILIFAVLIMVSSTFAWVNYVLNLPPGSASVGEIDYTINGNFIAANDPIYPGKNLVDQGFALNNESTIDTELRLKISYTRIIDSVVTNGVIYTNDVSDHLIVDFAISFVYGDDDFWYYQDQTTFFPEGLVTIIDTITYDGDYVSNNYSEENITISVLIQVKQAENVTWQDLSTHDFSTGYPEE